MSVKKKFNLWFSAIFIIFAISSGSAIYNFASVENNVEHLVDHTVQETIIGKEIQRAIATQGMFLRAYYLEQSDFNLDRLEHYNTLLQDQVTTLQSYESDYSKDILASLQTSTSTIIDAANRVVSTIDNGQFEQALVLINEDFSNANSDIYNLTVSLLETQTTVLAETESNTKDAVTFSTVLAIIGLLIGTVAIAILSVFVRRNIVKPLHNFSEQAAVIASGDLTQNNYVYDSKDELGVLSNAFNEMKQNLIDILQNVHASTGQVSAAAEQLAAGTEEIAQASDEVATNVTHTSELANSTTIAALECSYAMAETSAGVQRISESTQELLTNTMNMNDDAHHGVSTIHQAELQMEAIAEVTSNISAVTKELSKQSEEIGQMINVITMITEQTHLLALNAAIEAARAGEHGKGFAVVADEVRKLAEQSNESAVQIVSLTKQIQEGTKNVESAVGNGLSSVEQGVDIIKNAGDAFEMISTTIQTLTGQVQEISAASEQISASAEEVTAAVSEIAASAKESSESFESIASATEEQSATMVQINSVAMSLNTNAAELKQVMSKFKV